MPEDISDADFLAYLHSQQDQGLAALRDMVKKNSKQQVIGMLSHFVEMNNKMETPYKTIVGACCTYAISAGIVSFLESGGKFE